MSEWIVGACVYVVIRSQALISNHVSCGVMWCGVYSTRSSRGSPVSPRRSERQTNFKVYHRLSSIDQRV